MPQPHPVQGIMEDADGYETEELPDLERDGSQQEEERLHDVLDRLLYYCRHRGHLGDIREIIRVYNSTNPPEGPERPFDLDMAHEWRDGVTMLGEAASAGQLEYVDWLLKNGASPWVTTDSGESPLHLAIARDTQQYMRWGSEDQDPPNSAVSTVMAILHHVENCEKEQNVHLWETRDKWHRSPLDYSARKGGAEVLKLFISKGARVNGPLFKTQYGENSDAGVGGGRLYTEFGSSLLHHAIQFFNNDAVKILLADGAYTAVYNAEGETPLMCAITTGNAEAVRLLLACPHLDIEQKHGRVYEHITYSGNDEPYYDVNTTQLQFPGWTAIHCASLCFRRDRNAPSILRMLFAAGLDARSETEDGTTAFSIAQDRKDELLITELTEWDRTTPWSPEFKAKMRNSFTMSQEKHVSHRSPWYGLPGDVLDMFVNGIDGPLVNFDE
jgi:ankyrin repeat protein